ncbi:hypothetical protein BWI93_09960 [Siphonobacter sp. BAB-5385]|uniref:hypothetical protein n=1 Tax=Siphonobacter sp. BAB-5385 TaxID=1864822 RepID=UPI000B9E631F|nr:hypothetical protein [Siphonobacter sp. BAB-5385]OZI08318.1 hypothetical protein BWI93_09960 [Siphonobacter sp. BAB-5385]
MGITSFAHAQISVSFPVTRTVIQRDNANQADLYITGKISQAVSAVQARLVPRSGEGGTATNWQTIQNNPQNGVFSGALKGSGGRYDLEIRGVQGQTQVGSIAKVEKVGIGEVFLVVGHSNAQGGDGYSPSIPYEESNQVFRDQVNTIDFRETSPNWNAYWYQTASADLLPPLAPSQLCEQCGMAPGAPRWFWGRLGEMLVQRLQVPVLFYNAAIGGTNIELTYKAAYNIPFQHGFINYNLRHPYINIRNTLKKYVPQSGIRAILSGHGVNDRSSVGKSFEDDYIKLIAKTREEVGEGRLAWLVAQDCWIGGKCYGRYNPGDADNSSEHITRAQLNLVATVSDVYAGPDLNTIESDGRMDNLHFNQNGQKRAAEGWVSAITEPQKNISFLTKSTPVMAKAPVSATPDPVNVTSLKSGAWSDPSTWNCNCIPAYSSEVTIQKDHRVSVSGLFYAKTIKNQGELVHLIN